MLQVLIGTCPLLVLQPKGASVAPGCCIVRPQLNDMAPSLVPVLQGQPNGPPRVLEGAHISVVLATAVPSCTPQNCHQQTMPAGRPAGKPAHRSAACLLPEMPPAIVQPAMQLRRTVTAACHEGLAPARWMSPAALVAAGLAWQILVEGLVAAWPAVGASSRAATIGNQLDFQVCLRTAFGCNAVACVVLLLLLLQPRDGLPTVPIALG